MERMTITHFRANCPAVLERVRKTRKPVLVTRFGVPMAEIAPPARPERRVRWTGVMAGTARITGDIVGPASKRAGTGAGQASRAARTAAVSSPGEKGLGRKAPSSGGGMAPASM